MNIDLSGIETELLQALGIVLATAATYAIQQFVAKLKISKNSEIVSTLDDAVTKAIGAGVIDATDAIKAKGWDSVDVHNQVIAKAAQQLADHAQKALGNAGYDPSTPEGQKAIQGRITELLPKAMAQAAASPATPPVPAVQA